RPHPVRRQQPIDCRAHGQDRGLCVFGERETLGRTIEDQVAERFAQRGIRFEEDIAALGELAAERLAHPDRLRTLPWKEECNHRSVTALSSQRAGRTAALASAAISCSTRSSTPALAKREAI